MPRRLKGFRLQVLRSARVCDRRSIRLDIPKGAPEHRLQVCCPRGKYDARAERCRVGTVATDLYHPASENPGGDTGKVLKGAGY